MHELEKGVTRVERVYAPFVPIFDGMALVHMVKCTGLTYNQFADDLLKLVVAKSCGSKQIDVVLDLYRENSIKNAKEEIAQLVNSVQCHHCLHQDHTMGHFSIKQQKQIAVDSIFGIKVEKSMFSNWRIEVVCFLR